jgi:photosystem II stability/assembly factor-like uncharacterized protein
VSRDGGQTWTRTLEVQVYGNEAYRATGFVFAYNQQGELFLGSAGTGLWASLDHGETWVLRGLEHVNITHVAFDDKGQGWICAAPWTPFNKAPLTGGLFGTVDHGETWSLLQERGPEELVVAPDGSLVGLFEYEQVRRSEDHGKTWVDFRDGLPEDPDTKKPYTSDARFRGIASGHDFLLIGTSRGTIYRRGPGDERWTRIEREQVIEEVEGRPWWGRMQQDTWQHFGACLGGIMIMPGDPDHWWFTDWYSVYETTDAGKTWIQRVDGMEVTVIHHVLGDPVHPSIVHVGMADNAYARSSDGGVFCDMPKKTFSNIKMLGVSPVLPDRLYALSDPQQGGWRADRLRVSPDGGETWTLAGMNGLPPPKDHSMHSIAVNPANPDDIVLGLSGKIGEGGGVYRSTDGGHSFSCMSEGMAQGVPFFRHDIWVVGPELAMDSSGRMVAVSHDHGGAYAFDGTVWRPVEAGVGGKPQNLCASGQVFYLARLEGGLWRSDDGGGQWSQIRQGRASAVAVRWNNPDHLAVVVDAHMHISLDGGVNWDLYPLPPHGQVRSLAFAGDRLVAGTAGGGLFWLPLP